MKEHKRGHRGDQKDYQPPVVTRFGELVQFSGSPLNTLLTNPLDLPNQ